MEKKNLLHPRGRPAAHGRLLRLAGGQAAVDCWLGYEGTQRSFVASDAVVRTFESQAALDIEEVDLVCTEGQPQPLSLPDSHGRGKPRDERHPIVLGSATAESRLGPGTVELVGEISDVPRRGNGALCLQMSDHLSAEILGAPDARMKAHAVAVDAEVLRPNADDDPREA